ncbi:MAG TPA: hypothetical protein DC047_02980 [Blastocatellia bacterium]|nr:hypothetical protein [Blastocatellia bacterium]
MDAILGLTPRLYAVVRHAHFTVEESPNRTPDPNRFRLNFAPLCNLLFYPLAAVWHKIAHLFVRFWMSFSSVLFLNVCVDHLNFA